MKRRYISLFLKIAVKLKLGSNSRINIKTIQNVVTQYNLIVIDMPIFTYISL